MRWDIVSGSDKSIHYLLSREKGAVAVKADSYFGAEEVVEERVWGKAAADVTIFTMRSRELVLLVVWMSGLQRCQTERSREVDS